jgi:hypothetical protein
LTRAAFAAQLPLLSGAAPKLAGALEKRRPRHSHPEGSQGRVREVAVAHSWQNLVIPRRSPFTELLAQTGDFTQNDLFRFQNSAIQLFA